MERAVQKKSSSCFTRDYEMPYKSLLKQLVHLGIDSEKRVRDYLKRTEHFGYGVNTGMH
jgi:hypothetical protein